MAEEKLAIDGGEPVRKEFLHFHRASIGPEEEREVVAALHSGWLTTGPRTKAFEKAFAAYAGAKHAVAMNSCTAALHVSIAALGIGPGDEVIVPAITWCSTANVVVHTGATPIFADVLGESLLMDPASVRARITPRTKAIVPVHYIGQAADIDAIAAVAGKIPLVEDAAHAVETVYKKRKVGSISRTTCFSFYATKNMTTGEGGMLTTDDDGLADRARVLSLHGISRDAWKRYGDEGFKLYQVLAAGFKYNMFDLQAALGLKQLEKVEAMHRSRRALVGRYQERLAGIPGLTVLPQRERPGDVNAFHLLPVLVDTAERRDFALQALARERIGVGVHFPPVHLEPFYRERYGYGPGLCPLAEDAGARTLSLPLYPSLPESALEDVVRAVKKVMSSPPRKVARS
jgi:dTDP-4-amino-4,6-dideoxygalactose transaminase